MFRWREGFRDCVGVEAEKVGAELEALERANSGLTPGGVVEAAKDPHCTLHGLFEWDDTKAAGLYRERQASDVLRAIVKVVSGPDGKEQVVRAFFNVVVQEQDEEPKRCYINQESAFANARTREQIIEQAYRELQGWQDRWKTYSELMPASKEIQKVLDSVRRCETCGCVLNSRNKYTVCIPCMKKVPLLERESKKAPRKVLAAG